MDLAIACTNEEKVTVNATPKTSTGKAAVIDGALTVTVISGDGTVEQDPTTPLSFKAVSGDSASVTVYDVAGDTDLGAGVVTIHDTVTLTVTSAVAASFGLVAGVTEAK
jgi:hypothetical protein